jgi:hypothetical protein
MTVNHGASHSCRKRRFSQDPPDDPSRDRRGNRDAQPHGCFGVGTRIPTASATDPECAGCMADSGSGARTRLREFAGRRRRAAGPPPGPRLPRIPRLASGDHRATCSDGSRSGARRRGCGRRRLRALNHCRGTSRRRAAGLCGAGFTPPLSRWRWDGIPPRVRVLAEDPRRRTRSRAVPRSAGPHPARARTRGLQS